MCATLIGTDSISCRRRRFARDGVGFEAFIWEGGPGPVLLVNGATHGDEYEGPALLHQWVQAWRPKTLHGSVILVPILNEVAFFAGARCRPDDGANLARSFPGSRRGGPTHRLARLFDEELLSGCSHYVDLHSAGAANILLPWTGYIRGHTADISRTQRAMAACFDRFWCWSGPFLPGRTLSAAYKRRIPAIYTECRGGGGVAPRDLSALDRGMRRLLIALGLVPGRLPRLRRQIHRSTQSARETHLQEHHLSPQDGLFLPAVDLGQKVRRGEPAGRVISPAGRPAPIRVECSGRIVMLRQQRSVRKGDALAVVAPI